MKIALEIIAALTGSGKKESGGVFTEGLLYSSNTPVEDTLTGGEVVE